MADRNSPNSRRTEERVEPELANAQRERQNGDVVRDSDLPSSASAAHSSHSVYPNPAAPHRLDEADAERDMTDQQILDGQDVNGRDKNQRTVEQQAINQRGNAPRVASYPATHEPTLGQLFSSLSDDFTTLMRKEVELAAAELQESAKRALRAGIMVAVAGFLAYAGLILLLIAASIGLANALNSLWMGFGIVGLVVAVVAGILFASGKSKLEDVDLKPRRAIRSVEKDIEMAKEKLS